jgi:hypothetical protein
MPRILIILYVGTYDAKLENVSSSFSSCLNVLVGLLNLYKTLLLSWRKQSSLWRINKRRRFLCVWAKLVENCKIVNCKWIAKLCIIWPNYVHNWCCAAYSDRVIERHFCSTMAVNHGGGWWAHSMVELRSEENKVSKQDRNYFKLIFPERAFSDSRLQLRRWPTYIHRDENFAWVQGCQIFLDTIYQNGENIPNYHNT